MIPAQLPGSCRTMPVTDMGDRIRVLSPPRDPAGLPEANPDAHRMIIGAMAAEEGTQVGDVVELLAGGPAMTVQARSQDLAYCAWMADGRLHQGTFQLKSLRLIRSAGPAPRSVPPHRS